MFPSAAASLRSYLERPLCFPSLWGRVRVPLGKGILGGGKKRLEKFQMRVAADAKACISWLLLRNTFPHISWLKTTTLSYLPVSVSQGLSPAELGPLRRVSHAAAGCQDVVVIWSSDWGGIESTSIGGVHSPLPVPV